MDERIRTRIYLKLYYSLLDWEWIRDPNTLVVFIHLLLNANRKPQKYGNDIIRRGEVLASLNFLVTNTGLSVQKIRTALNHLESTHDITRRMIGKNVVYTIVSYDKWQTSNTETNNKPTTYQQRTNNEITTPIDCNNEENEIMRECVEEKHAHGKFKNVFLTDSQYQKFRADYPLIADDVTDQLSMKIAVDKKSYSDNHFAHLYIFARNYKPPKTEAVTEKYNSEPSFDTSVAFKIAERLDPANTKRIK